MRRSVAIGPIQGKVYRNTNAQRKTCLIAERSITAKKRLPEEMYMKG